MLADGGSHAAIDRLLPETYDELRRLAARLMRGERSNHTLQATALVHEVYLKLRGSSGLAGAERGHLLALAARAMREVLVDHARARTREKRGGGAMQVELAAIDGPGAAPAFDLISFDEALERLAAIDGRQVRLIELRYLAGLSVEEAADAMGVSTATIKRDSALAKAWLYRELGLGSRTPERAGHDRRA
jgi:RNA polymerase sigma factor (TIGR02999 family)